jgi:hypothetical protein
MATTLTWDSGALTSSPMNVAINSDPFPIPPNAAGWSLVLEVTGSGGSGVAGNFQLYVSNDGVTYGPLAGSLQTVLVSSGQTQVFTFSEVNEFYEYSYLVWTQAGSPSSGTMSNGAWSSGAAPSDISIEYAPSPGTPLTAFTPIMVSVTDTAELNRIVITVTFPGDSAPEVIYDSLEFSPLYALDSSVNPIADGFVFTLLRLGGWTGSPTFAVYASDDSGGISPYP